MDESEIIVSAKECKDNGFCISGCRTTLTKHGIDFRGFIKNGISIKTLRSMQEPMAEKLINIILTKRKENEIKLTAREVIELGKCFAGCKRLLERHHLDYREVVKNGITVGQLRALNDPMADEVVRLYLAKNKDI